MTEDALERKGIQVELAVHARLDVLKKEKELKLAKSGHPRQVTMSEVIADALGMVAK